MLKDVLMTRQKSFNEERLLDPKEPRRVCAVLPMHRNDKDKKDPKTRWQEWWQHSWKTWFAYIQIELWSGTSTDVLALICGVHPQESFRGIGLKRILSTFFGFWFIKRTNSTFCSCSNLPFMVRMVVLIYSNF